MSFVPANTRVRTTTATKRRDRNVIGLIGALRAGPMRRADLREAMNLSGSSINKYLTLLGDAGVIEIARYINPTAHSIGTAVFRLVRDTERVDDYLRSVEAGSEQRERKQWTRSIHRLQDDSPFRHAPQCNPIPAPDPVLAHFFGLIQPQANA